MKNKGSLVIMMFLASAVIIPIGTSYATYGDTPSFVPPPTTPPVNQTNTNMTMPASTNQTNTNMTMPASTNQTNTNMTMPASTNQTITQKPSVSLDPLKQFKSGVTAKDIQCKSGFSLVMKAEDGSPACVHSATVPILIQLGWASAQ